MLTSRRIPIRIRLDHFRRKPALCGRLFPALLALAAMSACSDAAGPSGGSAAPPAWARLSAGAAATCGVTTDGRGFCWGQPWIMAGQPTPPLVTSPAEVPGGHRWSDIEVGEELACGITTQGETYCWGGSNMGLQPMPVRISGDSGFTSLAVGTRHACGLTGGGAAYCWGDELRGALGDGVDQVFVTLTATPVAGGLRFVSLGAGWESACGLADSGDVYCWGASDVVGESLTPRRVQAGFGFTRMVYGDALAGLGRACAQAAAGTLYCFRYEPHEQLPQPTPAAVPLPGGAIARQFSVGGVALGEIGFPSSVQVFQACAVDGAATAWCWGDNKVGQLGDGTTTAHGAPAVVQQLSRVTQVTVGGAHACAVTTDGAAYCWGANNRGQLGIGKAGDPALLPQRVAAPGS
jgi:alpha-tubulin suppressor-like RCC1 family protein